MAKAAATRRDLSLVLSLFLLLNCLASTLPADIHSLNCNFIVKVHTTPPQPWCEGQCSVDGESFLQYDNDNKATPLGDLGKAAHATQVWTDLIQRLRYLGQELRKRLADTNLGTTKIHGHTTLQAIMISKYEQGEVIGASWRFNISGKYPFTLNTMNMSWSPISLEAGGVMNDEQFIKDLEIISTADSSHWLKELLKHKKEKPRPTSRTLDITELTSTRKIPNNKDSNITAVVISIIIILFVIVFICMCVKRKCPQGEIFSCPCTVPSTATSHREKRSPWSQMESSPTRPPKCPIRMSPRHGSKSIH